MLICFTDCGSYKQNQKSYNGIYNSLFFVSVKSKSNYPSNNNINCVIKFSHVVYPLFHLII